MDKNNNLKYWGEVHNTNIEKLQKEIRFKYWQAQYFISELEE